MANRKFKISIVALFLTLFCHEESKGQHGISLIYAPSKVIKHRESILFDVPKRTHEFRFAYTYQTKGTREWHHFWKKPKITINALWVDFGSQELGDAFALLPEIHFALKKYKSLTFNMQFGTGIAYLNNPFNPIDNPLNNAIGSNLNNTSSLKFGLEYQWSDQLSASLSTGIVHFSNGLSSSPNTGINIYGLTFNANYHFHTYVAVDPNSEIITRSNQEEENPLFRKWIADLQYQYGFTEHSTPGGPKYGVQAISIGLGYRYSRFMTVFAGGEYEYNDGVYTFFKRNFYTEEEALRKAKKTNIYLSNEFRYGPVFNRFRVGFYLGWPSINTKTNYLKVVTGIYLPRVTKHTRPYVGVVLKTHTAVADYLAIMGGVSF